MDVLDVVRPLAEQACRELGLELWDVSLERRGRTRTLFVSADKEAGITLAEVEALAQRLSARLDAADPIAGSYVLDVGSPGAERRLRHLDDVRRYLRRRAHVQTREPDATGRRTFTGTLAAAGEDRFWVDTDDGRRHEILWQSVERAHLKPLYRKGDGR